MEEKKRIEYDELRKELQQLSLTLAKLPLKLNKILFEKEEKEGKDNDNDK